MFTVGGLGTNSRQNEAHGTGQIQKVLQVTQF